MRGFWRHEAVTLGALIVGVAAASGLFFRSSPVLPIGLIVGLIAGLGARHWWSGAAVGALGVLGGFAGASLVSSPAWAPGLAWLPDALQAAALAVVLGACIAWLSGSRPRLLPVFSAVAVVVICGVMTMSALALASIPVPDSTGAPLTSLQQLSRTPAYGTHMSDDELFAIWVSHLRSGEGYYAMEARSFADANAARPTEPIAIHSPFSYRPPTLYVLLALLPPGGATLVLAMMLWCSAGVACAYLLARAFVRPSLALVGCIVLAAMLSGYGTMNLLDAESWAGVAALASVTAFVYARRVPSQERALTLVAIACALLATALRELMAPLLPLGLAATLVTPQLRRSRTWVAWAVGIALAAAGLSAHWLSAASASASYSARVSHGQWFTPNGSGLVGAVQYAAVHAWVIPGVCWALVLLGGAGSLLAPRDLSTRIMLAGVALGGPVALLFVHPPGETTTGVAPGYWGDMVLPVTYACVPLLLALVTRAKAAEKPVSEPVAEPLDAAA